MLLKWLAIAAALYLLALVAVTIGQRRLQYFPRGNARTPAEVGLAGGSDVTIETDDGERLHGWYIPPESRRPLLLYFHGNGGSLVDRAQRFAALTSTGYGLLAVEYRGYPGSTGTTTEAGLHRDAEAAHRYVQMRSLADTKLVILGESLGTGIAVALAVKHPPSALVLDSPYSSVVDVAAAQFWMFPARLILKDQFRSDLLIGKVGVPVLMVHGSVDRIIPLRFAEKLYGLANQPKQFIRVEGAGHLAMDDVLPQVLEWIDRTTG